MHQKSHIDNGCVRIKRKNVGFKTQDLRMPSKAETVGESGKVKERRRTQNMQVEHGRFTVKSRGMSEILSSIFSLQRKIGTSYISYWAQFVFTHE